jgi:hypothetical protein
VSISVSIIYKKEPKRDGVCTLNSTSKVCTVAQYDNNEEGKEENGMNQKLKEAR